MKVLVLHNPKAGDGDHTKERLLAEITAAGHQLLAYHSTKKKGWKKLLRDPGQAELVVVAGGDGTVGKVALALEAMPLPMAIMPLGSANNVATSLGITSHHAGWIASWDRAPVLEFDLGHAAANGKSGRFLEAFGLGLFTRLLEKASGGSEGGEEKVEAGAETLDDLLARASTSSWRITLDGEGFEESLLLLEVLNTPLLGPSLRLAPDADPSDGLLDVVLLRDHDREALAAQLEGTAAAPPSFDVRRARQVIIETDGAASHLDDELWPRKPEKIERVTITVEGSRRFLVPG
jgi:diacylglycerol kinase (ATP)